MGTFIHDFVKGECVTQVRAIGPQSDTIQPFTVVNLDVCPRDVHDISDAITLYTNQSLVEGNFPFTSRQQYAAKCVLAERSRHTLCCWLIIAVNVAENLSSLASVAVGYVCSYDHDIGPSILAFKSFVIAWLWLCNIAKVTLFSEAETTVKHPRHHNPCLAFGSISQSTVYQDQSLKVLNSAHLCIVLPI